MSAIGIVRKAIIACLFGALVLPVALYTTVYLRNYLPGLLDVVNLRTFPAPADTDLLANSKWGWYVIIDFANRFLPRDSTVLVFRQNDFVFYGKRRVIRDVDPRMISVYLQPGKEEAYLALLALGVGYVYLPPHDSPTQYNTPVGAVLADPELARLVLELRDTRLYRLIPAAERRTLKKRPLLDQPDDWSVYTVTQGWKAVTFPYLTPASDGEVFWLQSGDGAWQRPDTGNNKGFQPGSTLHVRARMTGKGWVRLYVLEYPAQFRAVPVVHPLRESALRGGESFDLDVQFRTSLNAASFRFMVTIKADGPFTVEGFDVLQVEEPLPYGLDAVGERIRAPGLAAGTVLRARKPGEGASFTGPGHYLVPPSKYGAAPGPAPAGDVPRTYRVEIEAEGQGMAMLSAVTFDASGTPQSRALEPLEFSPSRTATERILILPPTVREFRIGLVSMSQGYTVVDWAKRLLFAELPPPRATPPTEAVVRRFSVTPAPRAVEETRFRDCVLDQLQARTEIAGLCRP